MQKGERGGCYTFIRVTLIYIFLLFLTVKNSLELMFLFCTVMPSLNTLSYHILSYYLPGPGITMPP